MHPQNYANIDYSIFTHVLYDHYSAPWGLNNFDTTIDAFKYINRPSIDETI